MRIARQRWQGVVLLVALLLAACGSGDGDGGQSPRKTPYPRLRAAGPPCQFVYWVPWHNIRTTCIEVVYDNLAPPTAAPALGGLAFGPEGTLYMVRTAAGEIWAMPDADGDHVLDTPQIVAAGLNLPTYLTVHDGALLVATAAGELLRLAPAADGGFGDPAVLVDDLGGDTRFWPGHVRISPDGRIYVGLGGEVASFAPDGSDRRVAATGLRFAADVAWHPGTGDLWIADSRGRDAPHDVLFRVPADVALLPDFGYPDCLEPAPDDPACTDTIPPAFTFADQSDPVGLAFYAAQGWPFWAGDLIVALGGSWNRVEPSGYALSVVGVDAQGQPTGFYDYIAPTSENPDVAAPLAGFSLADRGFFPEHPADVALSAEGWLYVSVREGRIYRVRPRPEAKIDMPLTPTP